MTEGQIKRLPQSNVAFVLDLINSTDLNDVAALDRKLIIICERRFGLVPWFEPEF
jgi:hypothetical protein